MLTPDAPRRSTPTDGPAAPVCVVFSLLFHRGPGSTFLVLHIRFSRAAPPPHRAAAPCLFNWHSVPERSKAARGKKEMVTKKSEEEHEQVLILS